LFPRYLQQALMQLEQEQQVRRPQVLMQLVVE
jgi:hypothetical protein